MSACPQCQLPKQEDAWQCDGCGLVFRKDFAVVRTELQHKLRSTRVGLLVIVICSLAAVGGVILMAMYGLYYISIPLVLGIIGAFAAVFHRLSVLNDHLALLDRRHVPLPAATATIKED